ncbi:TetR family transcriptional regulator C-terminal domain-containing protein [Reinekea marinisedimentorum]|uniref:TetR/AcrR family transcriptional regulator n=1 Tax=Reinekea marinisedimentorum TaxID=230495 RepID=A0A4V2UJ56_9GAMM|nr:TetR family transcriptional regulator C-terminal domain-containing protein [Reinekea marinisedimentorum]TCS38790.1 TetR/AcrR family transcriptional regulator [Reinekea marinisedimentorum]
MPKSQKLVQKKSSAKTTPARQAMESRILRGAEQVFAEAGFRGAAMDRIAEQIGISKQNLLYYFSSKETLYRTVLQNIVDIWLERMAFINDVNASPEEIIRAYVRGKLELSRDYPCASKVFAQEIISGAPVISDYLKQHLKPLFDKDVELVRHWVDEGQLAATEPEHLFFAIWAMTQTYADFAVQIGLMMGKPALDQDDFDRASDFLAEMILNGICPPK